MMVKKGKMIVIDGADSSGKEVQSRKLVKYLTKQGFKVVFLDFPQYSKFTGKVVGEYLAGDFGDVNEVHPKLSSYPYAIDRFSRRDEINKWLASGVIIVCNRYVPSNLAFMSAKLPKSKRKDFIKWEENLEYKVLGIPKEDLVIFLHVPAKIGQELTYKKDEKVYMKGRGRGDIHERNLKFLEEVIKQYQWLSDNRKSFEAIECIRNGQFLPVDEIHNQVVDILRRRKVV
jgi:dTMP kinase